MSLLPVSKGWPIVEPAIAGSGALGAVTAPADHDLFVNPYHRQSAVSDSHPSL